MKKEKRYSFTQIIRHIIQIASFILVPGLFILIWNAIGGIYKAILEGTFTFQSMIAQILILVAVIPITILWGRFFCGYLCAFGSMQEFFHFIAGKLKIKQIKINKNIDKYMKFIKYGIIIGFIVLWTLKISLDTISPWNVFGNYSTYKGWSNFSYLLSFGGLLLLIIIISSLFIERVFCRYFCPLGGIFSIISKPRLYKIKKNKSSCINCNLCYNNCPMNIHVNEETMQYEKVISGECIDCFKCIKKCPANCLYDNPKEAISGTVASIAMVGLYYGGTIAANNGNTIENMNFSAASISQGKYTDGTYEGSGEGYRGTTTVQVTVANGSISSITIMDYEDDEQFFNMAKNTIISEIIRSQSIDVQTVSGATYSSNGIISAVADALNITISNQGTIDSETRKPNRGEDRNNHIKERDEFNSGTDSDTNSDANSGIAENGTNEQKAFSDLEDGIYEGTGAGRNGNIKASVTVKNGKVTSITIESHQEDEQYFVRAESTIISEIINEQSLDVQTVSGATMSSNGIIDAVANALNISYTNPNSSMENSHKGNHGRYNGRHNRRHNMGEIT